MGRTGSMAINAIILLTEGYLHGQLHHALLLVLGLSPAHLLGVLPFGRSNGCSQLPIVVRVVIVCHCVWRRSRTGDFVPSSGGVCGSTGYAVGSHDGARDGDPLPRRGAKAHGAVKERVTAHHGEGIRAAPQGMSAPPLAHVCKRVGATKKGAENVVRILECEVLLSELCPSRTRPGEARLPLRAKHVASIAKSCGARGSQALVVVQALLRVTKHGVSL
mmetsp:Transcript_16629/g.55892  ORF Transcript_16629/g.55892 Transcript_16629/m.55892 type:complete len:219 (-) Transcript_16629:257-913(-)